MKLYKKTLFILLLLPALLLGGCGDKYVGLKAPMALTGAYDDMENAPIRLRHGHARLKILAIGNSFTNCATQWLPPLVKRLDGDSICVAKLVRSGASLSMHWTSHINNSSDYKMYFSDGGEFVSTDITTIDDALMALDWDVIVLQQVSGLSGVYASYQPGLDYLLRLFHEVNPDVLTAWHVTWAYMPYATHDDFHRYGYDSKRMYAEIMKVAERVGREVDIMIPSATVVKHLREEFPEVTDGFTYDGYHIYQTGLAGYALSALWYECLISPFSGNSCLDSRTYFNIEGVDKEDIDRALDIVEANH